jgi:predicted porin
MINIAAASCLAAFTLPALAQSSVTLYGIVDTGVEYVSHANTKGEGIVRMPSITGSVPSRWGLRGREDLGGGYSAVFQLENGFNVRGGDAGQGGRLFGRQAWVGLSGPFGTLSLGRQNTMTFYSLLENDIIGPSIYGIGSLDSYLPNARSDNTVAYLGKFSGFTFGGTYSFGRDSTGTGNSPGQGTCAGQAAGAFTQCRQWSAMAKYDTSRFGGVVSYDEQRGGTGAAANFFDGVAPAALTSSGDKDARLVVNGYVKFSALKVIAGWLHRTVTTVSTQIPDVTSNLYFAGAQYFVTPAVVLEAEAYRIVNAEQDARATLGTLRSTYLLSKSTAVYVQTAYLANSRHAAYTVSAGGGGTTPAPGMGQLGLMVGLRHLF